MVINRELATKPFENGESAKRILERFYVKNCFENYLSSIYKPDNEYSTSIPDYKYHIMSQVIDYTDGLFTLPQLYCIFNASLIELEGWKYDYTVFNDFKDFIIHYIDKVVENKDELEDVENFKNNISGLNQVVFTILNDLLYESNIFDDDYEDYRYPYIGEDENVCSGELRELIWTHDALGKIKDMCKKFNRINDRVDALTSEGFEIKPCWVGSGGVGSAFYMFKNKEIRIQIAASKFKGNGNSKSKSALCAVIPYPTFLHKNCIRYYD
jgi:hypothetical protein